jgi:hypothetical protein
MTTRILASKIDPVAMLSLMADLMKSARQNLSNSGEVKLAASLMEMEVKVGTVVILTASYDAADDCWNISGDERLQPAVNRAQLKSL